MKLVKSTPAGIKTLDLMRPRIEMNIANVKQKQADPGLSVHPNWHKMLTEAPVSVMLPFNVVNSVLTDGRLKNLYETRKGRGNVDLGIRSGGEENVLGIPRDVHALERPVYGVLDINSYMREKGIGYPDYFSLAPAKQYGEIVLKTHPHVKDRSTFTNGDSLDFRDKSTLFDGPNLHHMAWLSQNSTLDPHERFGNTGDEHDVTGRGYIEAQIHGGVDLNKDVHSIHITVPQKYLQNNFQDMDDQIAGLERDIKQEQDWLKQSEMSKLADALRKQSAAHKLSAKFGIPLHIHSVWGSQKLGEHVVNPRTIKSEKDVLNDLERIESLMDGIWGLSKSESDRITSSSDPTVLDISRAPEQHINPNFYRITPQVTQAYEMMGRGNAVAHGQYVSDPSPSVGSGVTVAFDNDQELHNYIKDVYEPHLKKNVFPSLTPNKAVFLAPIPTRSIKHGNNSPFLTINHLHGVSVSQDKRGRVPFYYAMSKLASELGHQHPLITPAIAEYTEAPHQHHTIRMVDGNGRTVSARTAGASHVLSYVAVKPENVHSFLKMIHETSPSEDMKVRSILGVNDLPSEFSVKDIPTVISHTKKSEDILATLDRMESLFDAISGRF